MGNWIIPGIIAIVLASFSRVIQKSIFVNSKISSEITSIIYQLLTGVIILGIAVIHGLDFRGFSVLVPNLILTALLYACVNYFLFKSFKQSEASIVTILFSTNAVWMLLASSVFLGETITIQKAVGITLIIGVTAIISSDSGKLKLDKKLLYPLLAGAFLGLAFVNDAFILNTAELFTYLAFAFILPGLTLILTLIPQQKYRGIMDVTRVDLLKNLLLAFVYALSTILTFYSYQLGAEASVIGPLQQLSVVGTVILSYIILKERTQMKKKLIATVLAVAGGVILTLV